MSAITALFGMVAILVIGAVAVIAIQEWGKVQMARAGRTSSRGPSMTSHNCDRGE